MPLWMYVKSGEFREKKTYFALVVSDKRITKRLLEVSKLWWKLGNLWQILRGSWWIHELHAMLWDKSSVLFGWFITHTSWDLIWKTKAPVLRRVCGEESLFLKSSNFRKPHIFTNQTPFNSSISIFSSWIRCRLQYLNLLFWLVINTQQLSWKWHHRGIRRQQLDFTGICGHDTVKNVSKCGFRTKDGIVCKTNIGLMVCLLVCFCQLEIIANI